MRTLLASHTITGHAAVRANQRGVSHCRLAALLAVADLDVQVGRRLHARRASRRALLEAIADGLPPALVGRLSNLAVIEADDGAVVTVAPIHGQAGRHYKRQSRRHWRGATL